MAQTLKFGNGTWATKKGSTLAYNDEDGNFKPLPFTYTGAGKGTRVNKEGLIEVVENDRPRIDYTDSEDGVFLLEKAATNLITYSEDFSNSYWQKVRTTVSSNQSISPDGTLNADKLIENNSFDTHLMWSQNISISVGDVITWSVFAKKGERNFIFLRDTSAGSFTSWFDLENGIVGTKSGVLENKIEDYGNGWYRCSITYTSTTTVARGRIYTAIADFQEPYQGDGVSGVYIYGAMLEQNSVASSYIPTQGNPQTRVQETASGSGNSEVFNDSQGVLFANIAANDNDSSERFLSLSNGSSTNRISLWYYSATNGLAVAIYSSNVTQFFTTTVLPKDTLYSKISVKYKQNDFSLWVNGFEIATDTSGNTPIGLSELSFDRGDGALDFYGKTKEISYYDEILTDTELEYMTSYRSLSEMLKELNLKAL